MLRNFWTDECGAIISAELALVLTIAVLAMIVGLSEVAVAVNTELNDISNAIGALDQSYSYTGFIGSNGAGQTAKSKSYFNGALNVDSTDDCDCNSSCDLLVIPTLPKQG